jgi:peptide/nickel transport system permease protein
MRAVLARLLWSAVIVVGVTALTFAVAFVVPSDPARTVAGPKADAQTLASIRRELGLDAPLPVQYARYLGRLVRGDLGRSYVTRQDVFAAILERLPSTAFLALTAMSLATLLGIATGCFTAWRQGSSIDITVLVAALVALSMPVFWVGLILLYVFAFRLRWVPLGGFGAANVILPATALAVGQAAYYARLLHTNLRDVLAQDFIRTARAKGLPPYRVYGVHALRNALIPLLTVMGLDFAALMSGVVLTETVFNWPGLGRLAVEAVFNQDIPLVMGTVLFSALLVVGANLAVDCVYLLVDPRLRGSR